MTMIILSCGVESDFEGAQEIIDQYIATNNINAERTANGVYYEIKTPGSGVLPTGNNLFVCNLRGLLVDGREWINTNTGPTFRSLLNNPGIIDGLREGMAQFSDGSTGKLIIPPNLGFGNVEFNGVPPNSVLIIELSDVRVYTDAPAYNEEQLTAYIAEKMLEVTKTASGMYYTITEMGNDTMPMASSNVSVNYVGYFLDGTEFDANDPSLGPARFGLDQVIQGWTEGIQLYGVGGKGTLLIPSQLAYGASGQQSIPPHTPLLFDVELVSVDN